MSPRLSDIVLAQLAEKGHTDVVISDRTIDTLASRTIPVFTTRNPQDHAPAPYNDLICDPSVVDVDQDVAWMAHSSGSTGIPKLFPTKHRRALFELGPLRSKLSPKVSSWISSAPYNTVGLRLMNFCLTKEDGALMYFDNDRAPFTADGLTRFLLEARPRAIWVTPYAMELVSSTVLGLRILKEATNVGMFGSIMSSSLGHRLIEAGVFISSEYGLSEAGALMTSSLRPRDDPDWDYLMPINETMEKLLWFRPVKTHSTDSGEQLYELIVKDGAPMVLDDVKDSEGNFNTGDLVVRHPTKEGRWKLVGRQDDEIKCYQNDRQCIVNAFDYEHKIRAGNEDVLEEVVLFGQGKARLGVLVFAENADGAARKSVLERVWASIQAGINGKMKVPIEKDMIKIVAGSAELPRTTKLNIIRPQVYMAYRSIIDGAYGDEEKMAHIPLHTALHAVRSR